MIAALLAVDPGTFAVACVALALLIVLSVLLYVGK